MPRAGKKKKPTGPPKISATGATIPIDRSLSVQIGERIGAGGFGVIYKGESFHLRLSLSHNMRVSPLILPFQPLFYSLTHTPSLTPSLSLTHSLFHTHTHACTLAPCRQAICQGQGCRTRGHQNGGWDQIELAWAPPLPRAITQSPTAFRAQLLTHSQWLTLSRHRCTQQEHSHSSGLFSEMKCMERLGLVEWSSSSGSLFEAGKNLFNV